ncbi:MAG: shikimate dehydrogenase [Chitinophagaceae bacterium]|nr:shikimate dehydrogenase [Chitinophagaceae bacterium]MCB9047494.1 shikimate dehydrogenase [Chitinophagales bacterium]
MSSKALYGLIGYPLEHSFSPAYFSDKFRLENLNAEYRTFPISAIEDLPILLQQYPRLKGLNVTIPYKETVLSFLDALDPDAAVIGAVNCISFAGGKKTGYNTDVIGFRNSLSPLLQPYMTHALVLGSGGASKAVKFVLQQLGIDYNVVSRTKNTGYITYKDVDARMITENTLIVNTTPLGMYPTINDRPGIPYEALTNRHLLFDLIYNPEATLFLQSGAKHGAMIKNGKEMLQLQAEASWTIWNL